MTASDLAFKLADIVAKHTHSCGIWRKEPLTAKELALIKHAIDAELGDLLEEARLAEAMKA